ncbi:MAG: Fe(2+)-trafficking protein [Blastocatellia bacterium]|nr:Fe(2+)-trafficking protein [Blastocatellia bacterium]
MALETLCVQTKGTARWVVQALKEKGPMNVADLAAFTGFKEKEVTGALDDLIQLRLVKKHEGNTFRYSCLDEMKQIERIPFRTEGAQKIQQTSCTDCWKKWLGQQTVLMNHFGLNPIDPQAQKFLLAAMDSFFFGDGNPPMMVDTSLQGKIQHS